MEAKIDYPKIQFSPAVPMPVPFDVEKRIQQLRTYLDPNHPDYQSEYQHVNIKAIIKLYEEGKIDGMKKVYIKNGKIVSREESFRGPSPSTCEGMFYQLAQKHSYNNGPFGIGFHEIRMLLRLIPAYGGDGTVHGTISMNDTGPDVLSLFNTDLPLLGNINGYTGWRLPTFVTDANGTVTSFPRISVQVQLVGDNNTPWSSWINEEAIIRQVTPNFPRLSGAGIRNHLYIGTPPGNHHLAVAATKGGLTTLL